MRTTSLLKIKTWRKENATAPEDRYLAKLLPRIVDYSWRNIDSLGFDMAHDLAK